MTSMTPTTSIVIAIDGPAASGKGTIARALAKHYGFAHLDTGLLYRAIAHLLISESIGGDFTPEQAASIARSRAQDIFANAMLQQGEQLAPLRQEATGALASKVAALPSVRAELVVLQRRFASHPPQDAAGAILEGRDIATVICPWAQAQLYIDASLEARAARRFAELSGGGDSPSEADILEALKERDKRDRERANAPLFRAEKALLLDTSKLDIKESVARSIELVESQLRSAARRNPNAQG